MWTSFLLGRPGQEYTFEVPPEGMGIDPNPIVSVQRNLIGGLRKSTLCPAAPIIKVNSSFLSLAQRNQFASLLGVSDTFLSFQCRNDWQQVNDLISVIDANDFLLAQTSMLRLSQTLVQLGFASIITITGILVSGEGGGAWGDGPWGSFPWGGGPTYAPGAITYNDLTFTVTTQNPIPDVTAAVFITYTYTGWLVNMEKLNTKYQGGWGDRATYDFQLMGA